MTGGQLGQTGILRINWISKRQSLPTSAKTNCIKCTPKRPSLPTSVSCYLQFQHDKGYADSDMQKEPLQWTSHELVRTHSERVKEIWQELRELQGQLLPQTKQGEVADQGARAARPPGSLHCSSAHNTAAASFLPYESHEDFSFGQP